MSTPLGSPELRNRATRERIDRETLDAAHDPLDNGAEMVGCETAQEGIAFVVNGGDGLTAEGLGEGPTGMIDVHGIASGAMTGLLPPLIARRRRMSTGSVVLARPQSSPTSSVLEGAASLSTPRGCRSLA